LVENDRDPSRFRDRWRDEPATYLESTFWSDRTDFTR